ncbi:hypothetical protein V5O48_000997 [Marasmius crinis-equi]|uniref:Uncharacterized protein n=1 Tax=Marasmius crinis-equi TaxID=585013 RepID=A0ABR3FZK2_9AGAR
MNSICYHARTRIFHPIFFQNVTLARSSHQRFHSQSSVDSESPQPLAVPSDVNLELRRTSARGQTPSNNELQEYEEHIRRSSPITPHTRHKRSRKNVLQTKFDGRQQIMAEEIQKLFSKIPVPNGEGKANEDHKASGADESRPSSQEEEDREAHKKPKKLNKSRKAKAQEREETGEADETLETHKEPARARRRNRKIARRAKAVALVRKAKRVSAGGDVKEPAQGMNFTERVQGVLGVASTKAGALTKKTKRVSEKDSTGEEDVKESAPGLNFSKRIEGFLGEVSTADVLTDLEPPTQQNPIARLAHGLDRVLFNPGVHWLRDPRSRVYNFHPSIETIPKVFDFAFERLTGFVKSSRDEDLWALAKREDRKFGGSTSSLSGMLCHIYFMLSGNKDPDLSTLSKRFQREPSTFTPGQRMATSVVFNHKDGRYAVDSYSDNKEEAGKNILTWMGTLLEKYLTMEPSEFLTYMRTHARKPVIIEDEKASDGPIREAYRYSKSDTFVMRSQLDCQDPRLPGTGVFDIKTRACLPIRMDLLNFEESSGYLINKMFGMDGSFEREYYDLIRAAFLKYSFQVRIGNMDGVFVAYHNTERLFGFQYVSLEEMDQRIFSREPGAGDMVFRKCVQIMEAVSDEIVKCFPDESVRCTFEAEEVSGHLHVWIEPVEKKGETTPIKELVVTARNFLGENGVGGVFAIFNCTTNPCDYHSHPDTLIMSVLILFFTIGNVYWKISHVDEPEDQIRTRLNAAKERQFRAYSLPTGTNHSTIQEWWKNLNFGGTEETTGKLNIEEEIPDFFSTYFQEPDRKVAWLRHIAVQGRKETRKMEEEEKGKPKVVYGLGEVYLDEATEVEKLRESLGCEEGKVALDSRAEDECVQEPVEEDPSLGTEDVEVARNEGLGIVEDGESVEVRWNQKDVNSRTGESNLAGNLCPSREGDELEVAGGKTSRIDNDPSSVEQENENIPSGKAL